MTGPCVALSMPGADTVVLRLFNGVLWLISAYCFYDAVKKKRWSEVWLCLFAVVFFIVSLIWGRQ